MLIIYVRSYNNYYVHACMYACICTYVYAYMYVHINTLNMSFYLTHYTPSCIFTHHVSQFHTLVYQNNTFLCQNNTAKCVLFMRTQNTFLLCSACIRMTD